MRFLLIPRSLAALLFLLSVLFTCRPGPAAAQGLQSDDVARADDVAGPLVLEGTLSEYFIYLPQQSGPAGSVRFVVQNIGVQRHNLRVVGNGVDRATRTCVRASQARSRCSSPIPVPTPSTATSPITPTAGCQPPSSPRTPLPSLNPLAPAGSPATPEGAARAPTDGTEEWHTADRPSARPRRGARGGRRRPARGHRRRGGRPQRAAPPARLRAGQGGPPAAPGRISATPSPTWTRTPGSACRGRSTPC